MNASASHPQKIVSFNPATLKPLGEVSVVPPEAVQDIVRKSREAFPCWRDLGLKKRSQILKRAQQALLEKNEEVAKCITLEMGRPIVESLVLEVEASVDLIGYYADRSRTFLRDRRIPLHNPFFWRRKSYGHHQPLGVLGIIAPWNWPLLIPLGGIVPALLSGNTVVFKPSELTPLVGQRIGELFWEAGVPQKALQVIQGTGSVGEALVDSDAEKIFFTGSNSVGQRILRRAASSLKKVVLEMGGSDPAIVCDDADPEVASSGILWGGMTNCGQNCNAIERVILLERSATKFIERLLDKMKKLRIGDGMDWSTDVGPLASASQRKKMEAIVRKCKTHGSQCLAGGERLDGQDGYFFKPTLFFQRGSEAFPTDEEIFGPILMVACVKDDEEAVGLANRSSFGLAASVWTDNQRRGEAIARSLECGSVMINDAVVSFGMTESNWTGIKKSGIGWVHGEKGLDEMVNLQYINADPQNRIQKFWWFPYSEGIARGMKAGMQFLHSSRLRKRIRAIPTVLRTFTAYLLTNRIRSDKL